VSVDLTEEKPLDRRNREHEIDLSRVVPEATDMALG
jgi:hypothetical protein